MYDHLLEDNEKVYWRGKPDRLVYMIGGTGGIIAFVFILIWSIFAYSIAYPMFVNSSAAEFPGMGGFNVFKFMPLIFMVIPIIFLIIIPIYRLLAAGKVEYIVTDKRIYIISGLIGTDVQTLEYREIDKLSVHVDFLEKIKNVGTISLTPDITVGRGDSTRTVSGRNLIGIDNPYEVYKLIKNNTLDVTTDQYYPNDLRPKSNKGYNTKLDR